MTPAKKERPLGKSHQKIRCAVPRCGHTGGHHMNWGPCWIKGCPCKKYRPENRQSSFTPEGVE